MPTMVANNDGGGCGRVSGQVSGSILLREKAAVRPDSRFSPRVARQPLSLRRPVVTAYAQNQCRPLVYLGVSFGTWSSNTTAQSVDRQGVTWVFHHSLIGEPSLWATVRLYGIDDNRRKTARPDLSIGLLHQRRSLSST